MSEGRKGVNEGSEVKGGGEGREGGGGEEMQRVRREEGGAGRRGRGSLIKIN